jgi:hypothetical protein
LIAEWEKPVKLTGITCLPRQENRNGWIKDYAVYVSEDGVTWSDAAVGTWAATSDRHTVMFEKPVEARCLRFVGKSSYDPSQPYVSLAEMDILTATQE